MKTIMLIALSVIFLVLALCAAFALAQVTTPSPAARPTLKPAGTPSKTPEPNVRRVPTGTERPLPNKEHLEPGWPGTSDGSDLPESAKDTKIEVYQLMEKAAAFLRQRKPDQAMPIIRDAEKLDPKNGDLQIMLGVAFVGLHRMDDAVSAFQKAANLNPQNAMAHFDLCSAMISAEDVPRRQMNAMKPSG